MHPFHTNLSIVYLRATTSIPPLPRGDDSPASRLEVTRILETKRVEIYFEEIRNDSINLSRSKDTYKRGDLINLEYASYPRNSRTR